MRYALTILVLILSIGCTSDQVNVAGDARQVWSAEIGTDPLYSVGGVDAEGPSQFAGITSLSTLPDGTVWLGDGQSREIRVFDSSGQHVRTLGGRGQGPGEFTTVAVTGVMPDDEVLTFDRGGRRVAFFRTDGTLGSTSPITEPNGSSFDLVGVRLDGTVVGQTWSGVPSSGITEGDHYTDTVHVVAWENVEDEPDTVAAVPGRVFVPREGDIEILPFTSHPAVAVSDAVYIAAGPEFIVVRHGPEGASRSFESDRQPRPVDADVREAYREQLEETWPEPLLGSMLEALDSPYLPEHLPAYSDLVVSSDGELWARVWTPVSSAASEWDVFSPEGALVGRVYSPSNFTVMEVSDGVAIGVFTDSLGVEYLETRPITGR